MSASATKKVIIIAGPTAVGKTAIAVELAKHFNTEIISADSRQCYRELCIGVARPSLEELAAVPHHFIASHSIHQKVTAATFETYALQKAEEIFLKKDVVIMVGGTGLYIKAFCEGLDLIPEIPEEIHQQVIKAYQENGMEWLQEQMKIQDPVYYDQGEVYNPQRLMRALEVILTTGQSILHYQKKTVKNRPFTIIKTALELPKEVLHQRINQRVDAMMQQGLLEEVQSLLSYEHLNALQTVGYKEIFAYLHGQTTLQNAVEEIKKNTRQYAKRQMTWFKKDKSYRTFHPNAFKDLIEYVDLYTT